MIEIIDLPDISILTLKQRHSASIDACDTCGKEFPGRSAEVMYNRGYWWHRPCTRIMVDDKGKEFVDYDNGLRGLVSPPSVISEDD